MADGRDSVLRLAPHDPERTGWARITLSVRRALEETEQKLEYDIYYIKHVSVALDLLIMFETWKNLFWAGERR